MKNLVTAILMTVVTTVLLGLIYPLVVTGIAQVIFPAKANGQLIERDGQEPYERVTIDIPPDYIGEVQEALAGRRAAQVVVIV